MRYEARHFILTDNEGLYPYRQNILRTIAKLFDCRRPALRQRDSRLGTGHSRVRGNDRLEAYSTVWKDFAIVLVTK